jgi:uncharacterized RDD family membrane protein YckC
MTDQYRSQWPDRPESTEHAGISSSAPGPQYPPLPGFPALPLRSAYATWGQRVRGRLIDQAPTYVGLIIFSAGYLLWVVELALSSGSTLHLEGGAVVAMIIGLSVMLASLPWVAYNRWMIAGRSGQSLGKRVTKTRLIGEETQAPIGALNAFLRDLVHILDWLTVVGYLWPLWDDKKQTYADKIMKTIVVNAESST